MSNSFADKYPEDFERMVREYEQLVGWDAFDHEAIRAAIEAINRAGWMLHPKPPAKVVHVGMATEKASA